MSINPHDFDPKMEAITLIQTFLLFSPAMCIITKICAEKSSHLKDFLMVFLIF